MKTIGQHTCSNEGGSKFVIKNSPFLAEHKPEQKKNQFLGTGYYFWDNNIELARFWGRNHYNNQYYIIEANIDYVEDVFLDLVGSREDQKFLTDTLDKISQKFNVIVKDWCLGKIITFLLHLNNNDERYNGIFQFEGIRAVDNYPNSPSKIYFAEGKKNYTVLSPRYVICLLKLNDIVLQTKKIVEP